MLLSFIVSGFYSYSREIMKKYIFAFILSILLIIVVSPAITFAEDRIPDFRETSDSLEPLEGDWAFYWKKLLEPGDFDGDASSEVVEPSLYAPVPGAWNGYEVDGEKLSGSGYATYRLEVLLSTDKITAFKMPRILTAYRMWVDGEEVAGAGRVGTGTSESEPRYLPQEVFVMPDEESVEIILQVSNFHHRSGGILENIQVGTDQQVLSATKSRLAYELFLFGSLLVLGIYHLVLY